MTNPVAHDPAERDAFRYMDTFRFVAALIVVLEHARDLVWVDAGEASGAGVIALAVYFLAGLGHEAVMVFFVLSGFWITHSVEKRVNSEAFWPNYLIDRLSRLLVVILPALALGGLLDLAGAAAFGGPHYFDLTGAHTAPDNVFANLTPVILGGNLMFLQSLAVPPFGSNGPLWSLAYEFWYYVWFAALALVARRRFSVALASLGLAVIWPELLAGFVVWLLGSLLFYADRRWIARGKTLSKGAARKLLMLSALILAPILAVSRLNLLPLHLAEVLVGAAFALLVWSLLRGALRFPRRLLGPVAAYGAGSSFSLYCIHYPLIAFALAALDYDRRSLPGAGSGALMAGIIILAVTVGWLFSKATEANTGAIRGFVKTRLQIGTRASRL